MTPEIDTVRPRLRPGVVPLRRRPGEVQFGLDPGRATVVTGLPAPVADLATGLTGGRTVAELRDRVGPAHRAPLDALLHVLADRGLLDDAAAPRDPLPRRLAADATAAAARPAAGDPHDRASAAVEVRGDGRLAIAVALLLATAGVGHLRVNTQGLVTADDVGAGLTPDDIGLPRDAAIHAALRRVHDTVNTARFTRRRPDLVLLTDALVPDPAAIEGRGLPHLPIRVRDGVGLVGPLVIPGVTACLTCVDHHRADRDPCWPGIAAQLVGRPQLADLSAVHATAALAAAQALTALAWRTRPHIRPPTWNRTLELDPTAAVLRHRPWTPHPACGCVRTPPDG
ncbi:hypothetical protein [Actinokineospora sp. HUAS TT18]|uniref:hypothetical protein n=1 Tax=Actinokineospora sp. HUAS TT18 TaxID=3447451 RepID=UPI003F528C98